MVRRAPSPDCDLRIPISFEVQKRKGHSSPLIQNLQARLTVRWTTDGSPLSNKIVCVLDEACAWLEPAKEGLIEVGVVLDGRLEEPVEGDPRIVGVSGGQGVLCVLWEFVDAPLVKALFAEILGVFVVVEALDLFRGRH
jgi:hypothetical protein